MARPGSISRPSTEPEKPSRFAFRRARPGSIKDVGAVTREDVLPPHNEMTAMSGVIQPTLFVAVYEANGTEGKKSRTNDYDPSRPEPRAQPIPWHEPDDPDALNRFFRRR